MIMPLFVVLALTADPSGRPSEQDAAPNATASPVLLAPPAAPPQPGISASQQAPTPPTQPSQPLRRRGRTGGTAEPGVISVGGWIHASFTASTDRVEQLPMGFNYRANQFLLQQNWLRIQRAVNK